MLNKISLLFNTIKHLKFIQIKYQLFYRLKRPKPLLNYHRDFNVNDINFLPFTEGPPVLKSFVKKNNSFVFLNKLKDFNDHIQWDYNEYGKLWNYYLQYANYLLQDDISNPSKLKLIRSLYDWLNDGKLKLEPYPASLRIINVIRFLSLNKINDPELKSNLHAELDFLSNRLEFHLLGNHLLENGFAMMMGGAFFSEEKWLKLGQLIIENQIQEQVLSDGGHFELSPMYHQIIFFRLLELLDWLSTYPNKDLAFERFLIDKAGLMLSWLKNITFTNGDIPCFNDSVIDVAFSTEWLLSYARKLGVADNFHPKLEASGYRLIRRGPYEIAIDLAPIGASYQPGHGHSDALSFILYHKNKPILVEQGTSTYQSGYRRNQERSTKAHNTVVIRNENQSQVWGAFRVAQRAEVEIISESEEGIFAQHDGYKHLGLTHQRRFKYSNYNLNIEDSILGLNDYSTIAYFHIHPDIEFDIKKDTLYLSNGLVIIFNDAKNIDFENYEMADGYNKYRNGVKLAIQFIHNLSTEIIFS